MALLQFFQILVAFTIISFETPLILAPIFPLLLFYYLFQRLYIPTSRQLRRIESTSRSPIYNHFSETVNGATSIRAYGSCDQFIEESNKRLDDNQICYFPTFTAAQWLSIRLEFLGYSIVLLAAIFAVISRNSLSPGIAGLAISYSLNISSILGLFVRSVSSVETNIVSVERCLEYTETPTEVLRRKY
jgi:ABC-type multidrug transport system fused ATPase/permease subunit